MFGFFSRICSITLKKRKLEVCHLGVRHVRLLRMSEATHPLPEQDNRPKLRSHKIRIEIVDGPEAGRVVELPGHGCRVGSARNCELVLQDPTVSHLHARLRIERDRIRITDAGSRNGTMVDGLLILDTYARPDSVVSIGTTTLRLRMLDDFVEVPLSSRERMSGLLGRSPAMRHVFALLERVAPSDTTVLLEGETGTGKELAAEAIHEASSRASHPFVVFDCSATTSTLIESELFGHVRGSFTGADKDRAGAFEAAHGGTLFLDEIGELPLDLQPKLLGALERRKIRRIGSNVARPVDVRIIAATNQNLARDVERGRFRQDLFYRLAVVHVVLPPLRERAEDIPYLVRHFETEMRRNEASIPQEIVQRFLERTWPGNVRELRNAVERALSLHSLGNRIQTEVASEELAAAPTLNTTVSLSEKLIDGRQRVADAYEKQYLELVLRKTEGNISRAAEMAGVSRRFMHRAINLYGLRTPEATEE